MDNKRALVDTKDTEGNPIQLIVLRPGNKIIQEANLAYNLKVAQLIRQGSTNGDRLLLKSELENYLKDSGIWTTKDIIRVEQLAIEIRAAELMIKKGGLKLSEARELAISMAEKRAEILAIYEKRQALDSATIESHAENFRFEFLAVKCILHSGTGKQYLKDHDDYVNRSTEEAVIDAVKVLANIVYKLEDNIRMTMFEMQWLKNAGFVDDNGRYIKNGRLVDRHGRAVDDKGRYVNEQGQLINKDGSLIDENGNLLSQSSKPFIDDDTGKEVVICGIGEGNITPTKKRTKK